MASNDCPNCHVPMPKHGRSTYRCPNCIFERPVRAYKHRNDTITPSQQKAIDWCKAEFWRRRTYGMADAAERYEWKKFEVQLMPIGLVCVVMEIGMKNDQGKLSSVLCRSWLQVFIGRQGALTTYHKGKNVCGPEVMNCYS